MTYSLNGHIFVMHYCRMNEIEHRKILTQWSPRAKFKKIIVILPNQMMNYH